MIEMRRMVSVRLNPPRDLHRCGWQLLIDQGTVTVTNPVDVL